MHQQVVNDCRLRPHDDLIHDLGAEDFRRPVFHFTKLRADLRFQGKAAQDAGTERMDGLDFQTPRRFNRAGKKGAGVVQLRPVNLPTSAQRLQCGAQGVVRHHRPVAKPLEQAVLHLGGGGFGVGQAEDVLR